MLTKGTNPILNHLLNLIELEIVSGTYPEVTSDKDISSEEFTHKTPGRLPMTAGWDQQDQFKWSWSRSRADDPYQYDQMSD